MSWTEAAQHDEIQDLKDRVRELEEALAFAACTIKSGEPWTETCDEVIGRLLEKGGDGE